MDRIFDALKVCNEVTGQGLFSTPVSGQLNRILHKWEDSLGTLALFSHRMTVGSIRMRP